jgi:predicted PurR-regulated permease PerM
MDNDSLKAQATRETSAPDSAPAEPTIVNIPMNMRSLATTLVAILAVIFALRWARDILVPFVLGILISYALSPLVTWMNGLKIPRAVGAALLLTALIVGTGMLSYPLGEEGVAALEKLPKSLETFKYALEKSPFGQKHSIQKAIEAASEIGKIASGSAGGSPPQVQEERQVPQANVEQLGTSIREYLWLGSRGAIEFFGQMVLILFLIYYLLVSGDFFKRKIVTLAGPTFAAKRITVEILDEINTQIQRFLLVQVFASALVGVVTWIAFRVMGMEYSGFWGIAAGVLHTIPYFGPSILMVGCGLMAFLQFETFKMVFLVAAISIVIAGLIGMLLVPWVTSRTARMNAGAVFISLLFWNWIWGVWGLLLGIPITVVLKTVCDHIENLNPVGKLLGE